MKWKPVKKNLKKPVLPNDTPRLTVVRNLLKQAESEEVKKEPEKKDKKRNMPDERHGYIKSKKHDCL